MIYFLLIENENIDRILYYTDKIKNPTSSHKLTTIIHSNDLICVDTWHEYKVSSRDFKIIPSFLIDLISSIKFGTLKSESFD